MSTASPAGRHFLGKYELRNRLGRGGMAEVWKAYDAQLERHVAIKILHADLQADPEFMTRFVREARVIASLHHSNIVQIHDFQISNPPESNPPIAYMVMDYVEGQTLAGYIRATSRAEMFPPDAALVQLFASISRAIDYAHQHGMIHRDIKPANILLDRRNTTHCPMGEPILTDFGIAKLLGVSTGTISGGWLGTPLYISPEQAQGYPGNERSDIYSLGVILYEICTGVQPFRAESISALMTQHINAMPLSPALLRPAISPALSMVILRSLAKDPAARFSSASAMTVALAEALNTPVPADFTDMVHRLDEMSAPTYRTSLQPNVPVGMTPPSLSPVQVSGQHSLPVSLSAPAYSVPPGGRQGNPTTPFPNTPEGTSLANSSPGLQTLTPSQTPSGTPPPLPSPPPRRRRKSLLFVLVPLLIIILLGAGLGGFYWFTRVSSAPATVANPILGHAFFISSGQVSEHNNKGINDEMLIDLQNIPAPAPGKSYYAWLLGDAAQPLAAPVALGKLTVGNGTVHLLYPGDASHTNLIATTSRFLITEEDASISPNLPSPDKGSWRYYAQLPQTPDSMDMMHEGALQHLRHLLADAPELMNFNLPGGFDIWLFRNAEKVFEWASSTRDSWERQEVNGMRNQFIRILDYLDGKSYVQRDVPPGAPNLVNPRIAPLALLELDQQNQDPPGLLYMIGIHLNALTQAPGIAQENHTLAAQIYQESNYVQTLYQQVRQDARRLITMTTAQLLSQSSLSILDDMETAARYAFIGQIDPNTNAEQGGVVEIHYNIQRLATFNIAAFKSS